MFGLRGFHRFCVLAAGLAVAWASPVEARVSRAISPAPLSVVIPAGALAPGPAVITSEQLNETPTWRQTVRFRVDDSGGARLELIFDDRVQSGREGPLVVRVRATDSRGRTWQTDIEPGKDVALSSQVFVGDAASFARFAGLLTETRAQRQAAHEEHGSPPPQDEAIKSLQPQELGPDPCERLQGSSLVVVGARQGAGVIVDRCAAQGLDVIALATVVDRPASRTLVPKRWGRGRVLIVASLEQAASVASRTHENWHDRFGDNPSVHNAGNYRQRARTPGSVRSTVLVLLGFELALVIACGILVARRFRRPAVSWLWFPAAAVAMSAVLALIGQKWRSGDVGMFVDRIRVLSPSGFGDEATRISITSASSGFHRLRFPGSARIESMNEPWHFGSPFTPEPEQIAIAEDRIEGHMTIEGLRSTRLGTVTIETKAISAGAAPRMDKQGDTWIARNATEQRFEAALICRPGDQEASFEPWEPGTQRSLDFRARNAFNGDDAGKEQSLVQRLSAEFDYACQNVPADSYLMVAAVAAPPIQGFASTPDLPVSGATLVVVVGPLPGSEVTP